MPDIEAVLHYLRGLGAEGGGRAGGGRWPFVTISREAGAGGHALAEALLDEFDRRGLPELSGWQVFDRALCARVADDPSVRVSLAALLGDEFRGGFEELLHQLLAGDTPQLRAHRKLFRLIGGVARAGKAIIIGHGAACLTRGELRGLHLRLVAPMRARVLRVTRGRGLSEWEAVRWINRRDADRARFVRAYFGEEIADPALYDAVFNTAAQGMPAISAAVAGMLEARLRAETLAAV